MEDRTALLEATDVKFAADSEGNRKEVIISYGKFRELVQIVEDHIFLHSPEIQEQIRQSEEDIKAGKYIEFKADEIDKLLEWLDEEEGQSKEMKNE